MSKNEEECRERIRQLVMNFWRSFHQKKFIAGKSKVHYAGRVYDGEEIATLVDCALDFWLTLGKYGVLFEKKITKYLGVKEAVLVNSGSSANLIAISTLMSNRIKRRVKRGDEVITPATTFPTTLNPILQNGLVPVLVDVGIGDYNAKLDEVERAITSRTRMLVLPHTLGNPNDMDWVIEIAEKSGLYVIEDTCDALGSEYGGKKLGSFGDMGTFSFYPAHHITMGEGGAVVTNNEQFAEIARSLRDWGRACTCKVCGYTNNPRYKCPLRYGYGERTLPTDYDKRYTYVEIGYNLKPTDMQAAVGFAQLKKLIAFIKARKRNFEALYRIFSEYEEHFILPKSVPKADPCWFAFPLTVVSKKFNREKIVKFLEDRNIETRPLFAGNITRQPAYRGLKFKKVSKLINADRILKSTFFIGVYPGIGRDEIEYIANVVEEFMSKHC